MQKLKNNVARPKFTGSYLKKRVLETMPQIEIQIYVNRLKWPQNILGRHKEATIEAKKPEYAPFETNTNAIRKADSTTHVRSLCPISWVACDVTSVLIRHGVVHMEVKQQRPRADLEARR